MIQQLIVYPGYTAQKFRERSFPGAAGCRSVRGADRRRELREQSIQSR